MDRWLIKNGDKTESRQTKTKDREQTRRDKILAPFLAGDEGKERPLAPKPSFFPRKLKSSSGLDDAGLMTSRKDGPSHDQIRRQLLGSLDSTANPITNSQHRCIRDTAMVSTSTGHQVSDRGGGSGARDYWLSRHGKLAIQATEEGLDSEILRGVVAYVNGYTGPKTTDLELKRLIHRHGGQVRYVLSQRACTHVITAMPLCASKMQKEVKRKRSGIHGAPVYVRPDWILDSVNQGVRLAEARYPILEDKTMARVYDMFKSSEDESPSADIAVEQQSVRGSV